MDLTNLIKTLLDVDESIASQLHDNWRLRELNEIPEAVRQLKEFPTIVRRLNALIEMAERLNNTVNEPPTMVRRSRDAAEYIRPDICGLKHEEFWIILLNTRLEIIGKFQQATGGINGVSVDLRIGFKKAIEAGATNIILAHNHPSGNEKPSQADIALTKKFVDAGKILDIKVLDHIIITKYGFTSLADDGYM